MYWVFNLKTHLHLHLHHHHLHLHHHHLHRHLRHHPLPPPLLLLLHPFLPLLLPLLHPFSFCRHLRRRTRWTIGFSRTCGACSESIIGWRRTSRREQSAYFAAKRSPTSIWRDAGALGVGCAFTPSASRVP